tara:strand:- start:2964 stop:3239 length:276 start_codon:yes stop_codon:yes gene_type:complete
MTLKQMIEVIKEQHPEVSDQRIVQLLNRANREFSIQSRVSNSSYVVSGGTVKNQTYYTLPTAITTIEDVYINKECADRLAGKPKKEDEDLT